jgi:hypothetical protein
MTEIGAILIPLALTFVFPGIIATFFFLRKQAVDVTLFILYSACFGFGSQIFIALSEHFFFFLSSDPAVRVTVAAIGLLTILTYGCVRIKRKNKLLKITVSSYDVIVLIVVCILGLLLYGIIAHLPNGYFNSGSDQYYWLAYAQRAAYDPSIIVSFILRDPIYQSVFFLIILPYTAFLPKTLFAYQLFMELWPYGIYTLTAVALARLAYEALPVRTPSIFAPIAFYMLHWSNYYAISTDVVPQNIGIFLFIMGFILLNKNISGGVGIAFMTLFYAAHTATFTIFALAVGTAKIAYEGVRVIITWIKKGKYESEWHIFEKISFIPACVVTVFYGLYGAGILRYRPLESIGYADEYAKNFTLWTQPYFDTPQNTVIWLAIAGLALIPILAYFDQSRRRLLLGLGFAFILPWVFLTTPLIAYHAFFASWQSFRYYLVMYPSIAVLALFPLSTAIFLIARLISKNLSVALLIIIIILNIPIMLKITAHQQELVALDMITGRDGGVYAKLQIKRIQEFSAINKMFPIGAVVSIGSHIMTPYTQWIVAPRPWFIAYAEWCDIRSCPTYDMFSHKEKIVWEIPSLGLGLIEKGISKEAESRAVFEKLFNTWDEDEKYVIYHDPRSL